MTTLSIWVASFVGLGGLSAIAWMGWMLIQAGQNKEKAKHADEKIDAANELAEKIVAEAQRQADAPLTPGAAAAELRRRARLKRSTDQT